MPMYEFRCTGCGHEFEEITPSDGAAPPCPSCRGEATERLLSACYCACSAPSGDYSPASASSGGGRCGGCSGGNCASCH